MKIKNEQGEEVEVFTAEEVGQKVKEVEDKKVVEIEEIKKTVSKEFEEKINSTNTTLETLKAEKEELEKKIGGGGQIDNFKELKSALDKKTESIEKLQNEISDYKTTQREKEINAVISSKTKGDKELEKKVKLHFKETLSAMPEGTDEEMSKKLESALKLASDGDEPNPLDFAGGGGGRGFDASQTGGVEFTGREKALGAKMGISEADYKKYGPKIK